MNFFSKYKYTLIVTFIALLIFILGVVFIKKYITPRAQSVEAYTSGSDSNVNVIMFHVTWCPYCKTAKPVWDKLYSNYNGVVIKNKKLNIVSIDATDETAMNPDFNMTIEDLMKKLKRNGSPYTVEGYPTIIICDTSFNVVAEFDKNTTYENLEKFLDESL